MNNSINKIVIATLALCFFSKTAMSVDILIATCQACDKLPKPKGRCLDGELPPTIVFCGSELWSRGQGLECKIFENVTVYCLGGGTIQYTDERWYGAGSTCDSSPGSDHHCY